MNNTEFNHTSSLNSSDTIDRNKSDLSQNFTPGGSQTCSQKLNPILINFNTADIQISTPGGSQKLNPILTNSKTADTQNSTPGESQICSQELSSVLSNFKTIDAQKYPPRARQISNQKLNSTLTNPYRHNKPQTPYLTKNMLQSNFSNSIKSKGPPHTAKLLGEKETYEDFFEREIKNYDTDLWRRTSFLERMTHNYRTILIVLSEKSPIILILTEHVLKEAKLKATGLPGYCLVSHYCRTQHDYGGVAIFLKEDSTLQLELVIAEQLNLPATRVTRRSSTSIDCICSNLPLDNFTVDILEIGLSDHKGQFCTLNSAIDQTINQSKLKRQITPQSLEVLRMNLLKHDWIRVYAADDSYNSFLHILTMELNNACPVNTFTADDKITGDRKCGNFFCFLLTQNGVRIAERVVQGIPEASLAGTGDIMSVPGLLVIRTDVGPRVVCARSALGFGTNTR
ncbi:hypothetical protein J6590_067052 [Homalodisca vitripennis]|nr:hypothetical protein J6590_067052 [Homalodisca vitripennis]